MQYTALKQTLNSLREEDPRNAAEYAYALAQIYKRKGDDEQAVRFGRESIALFDKCSLESIDDCVAHNTVIEGVALPELIHQDVVRSRLHPLDI